MTANFEQAKAFPDASGMGSLMPAQDQRGPSVPDIIRERPSPRQQSTNAPARRLWNLFRQAPGFICILRGPDHVFEFANESYLRMIGGRDVIGKPLLEALPEIAEQGFADILTEVFLAGEPYTSFETPVQLQHRPEGLLEERFLDFVYQPIRDLRGRTTGVFVEGFDVTERVYAQAALRQGETQLRQQARLFDTTLSSIADFAYTLDSEGRFVYANKPLLDLWEMRAEEAVGKTFLELPYEHCLAERLHGQVLQVFATGKRITDETAYPGPEGETGYHEYIFTPVFDEEGEVELVAGSTRDITERKRDEKARAWLASIVDSCDEAIFSQDFRGVVSSWNNYAERTFGYTAGEAIGRTIAALIIPDDRLEEEVDILRRIARGEVIDRYETIRRHKDGSLLEMSVTISPLYENGRIVGASKIAHYIGERKRNDRHRELLIQELNHRVKNTLATVQSLALHSLRSADSAGAGYAVFDARLLALSRAHDVLTREHWAFAGLRKIVAGAIAPYSTPDCPSRFEVRGASLRLQPRAGLALAMALHELATNAVKYGALSGEDEDGRVAIHWQRSRGGKGGAARFNLSWTERGGPPVVPPGRHGFGSRLVRQGLAQDLGGAVDLRFEPAGVVCEISAPLDWILAKDEIPPA